MKKAKQNLHRLDFPLPVPAHVRPHGGLPSTPARTLRILKASPLVRYAELFRDNKLLPLLGNSLEMALLSSLLATVMGTAAALGIHRMGPGSGPHPDRNQHPHDQPGHCHRRVPVPPLRIHRGHDAEQHHSGLLDPADCPRDLQPPYVILNVMPKLTQMDPALQEAALIWGVLPSRLSRKVTIHEIMPGIVSGAIMAFTMSLDDFVISYFVYGPSYVTPAGGNLQLHQKPLQPKNLCPFSPCCSP